MPYSRILSTDARPTAHAPNPAVASALASIQRLDDLRVRPRYALIGAMSMPTLTRRRDPDAHNETWRIFYGDVHVRTIAIRSGNPTTAYKPDDISRLTIE